jgi:hypothetical protein
MMRGLYLSITLLFLLSFSCQKEDSPDLNTTAEVNQPTGNLAISIIEDTFEDTPIVVVGSGRRDFMTAFKRTFAGGLRHFTATDDRLPIVMEDDLGNKWNAFGLALQGPNKGESLTPVNTGMGYWFAFGASYPGTEIYGEEPKTVNIQTDTSAEWGVPEAYVTQGAGFDGIPALDEPEFIAYNIINTDPSTPFYLDGDDLVIGVSINGESKAYPHAILDWHEVVNDEVGGVPITVSYCPLTGTAKVWKKENDGPDFTFGVSGYLYNSNVIPFDRGTESFWSQLEAISIFGPRKGEQLEMIPFLETSWQTWQSMIIEDPLVMTENTGFDRDYSNFPYGDYKTSELIAYPVLYNDDRLHEKERVLGVIINGKAKVYRLSDF